MKVFIAVTALGGLISCSYAHIAMPHLLVNRTDTGLWKNILEVAIGDPGSTGSNWGLLTPQTKEDFLGANMTCGRNAFSSLEKTEIADVVAGEEIGFRVMTNAEIYPDGNKPPGESSGFFHPGLAQVYLSRAPKDELKKYHGDGDWFKVAYAGPRNNYEWELYRADEHPIPEFNFTLPKGTPPGKYLMRIEYLYPSPDENMAQWYINCALVNVMGPGGGTPTGFVKFPGAYDIKDYGIWIPYNQAMYVVANETLRLMEYKPPGPPVWRG